MVRSDWRTKLWKLPSVLATLHFSRAHPNPALLQAMGLYSCTRSLLGLPAAPSVVLVCSVSLYQRERQKQHAETAWPLWDWRQREEWSKPKFDHLLRCWVPILHFLLFFLTWMYDFPSVGFISLLLCKFCYSLHNVSTEQVCNCHRLLYSITTSTGVNLSPLVTQRHCVNRCEPVRVCYTASLHQQVWTCQRLLYSITTTTGV